jgi:hypothetical protein
LSGELVFSEALFHFLFAYLQTKQFLKEKRGRAGLHCTEYAGDGDKFVEISHLQGFHASTPQHSHSVRTHDMQKDREIKFAVQGQESGVNIFKTDTANPITYASPSKKHTQIRKVDAPVPVRSSLHPLRPLSTFMPLQKSRSRFEDGTTMRN